MAINYPIIETQLRLIRALQRGYTEALEAGDWQAAEYRCLHLHRLCEGLYHLSQLLDRGNSIPEPMSSQRNVNGWVSNIRPVGPSNHASTQALNAADKSMASSPPATDPMRYEWGSGLQVKKPPIDEVWE